mgnify:CR=1 FL=1
MNATVQDNPPPERYAALALQLATACVNDCRDRSAARERMAGNLARAGAMVGASKAFIRQFIFEIKGGKHQIVETVPGEKTVVPPTVEAPLVALARRGYDHERLLRRDLLERLAGDDADPRLGHCHGFRHSRRNP